MRRPLRSVPICSAALCLLAAAPARADDLDKMQGTWKAVYAAASGNVASPAILKGIKVTVSGSELTLVEPGATETIVLTLNEAARPHKHVNFGERSGVGTGKRKKKTDATLYLGIYQFEGPNRLLLCWGPVGDPRPQGFNARRSKGHRYYILEK